MKLRYYITVFYVVCGVAGVYAAPNVDPTERQLDSLQAVIVRLEKEIRTGKALETDVLMSLNARQQESALHEVSVRNYEIRLQGISDSITALEKAIPQRELDLTDVQIRIRELDEYRIPLGKALARLLLAERRLNRWTVLDFLLKADSWQELLHRRNLVTRLQETEQRRQRKLSDEISRMKNSETQLVFQTVGLKRARQELELKRVDFRLTAELLREEQRAMKRSQAALRRQLERIRRDRNLLEMQRNQSARALDAIEDMIESAARGVAIAGTPLNLLKGTLPWPVSCLLIERFGKSRNEQLETVTDNPGIELGCDTDHPVRAVAPGQVSSVTWLRGFGNVCIVEHPGSYYTVYARLGQVTVKTNDVVSDSSVIGYPGFDPLNETYRVHFEIWDRREKQDPLTWLRKQ